MRSNLTDISCYGMLVIIETYRDYDVVHAIEWVVYAAELT